MGELNWVYTALVMLAISTVFYGLQLVRQKPVFREGGWGAMLLATVCLVISLVIRSINADYFALSNMYESLLVVCIGILASFLVVDRWFGIRTLGFPVALLVLGTVYYDLSLPTEIAPLQPALQSYWRSIHVPIILLSYALFTLAFLSSAVYLLKDFLDKGNNGGGKAQLAPATAGGPPAEAGKRDYYGMFSENTDVLALEEALIRDQANIYDEITYRCVAFGFPLLAVGIILGGMWANEAWGNYWSWDPKESMSLVTLLGYGVYLHLRVNGEHGPRLLSWVSVIGFALMLLTYFGVNLMGVGLHSYGKIG